MFFSLQIVKSVKTDQLTVTLHLLPGEIYLLFDIKTLTQCVIIAVVKIIKIHSRVRLSVKSDHPTARQLLIGEIPQFLSPSLIFYQRNHYPHRILSRSQTTVIISQI